MKLHSIRTLSGLHTGKRIAYEDRTGGYRETEAITMITHKKNGWVLVRHGKNNKQATLHPDKRFFVLDEEPPVYSASI